jgi:thioredoxin reductase (NADPH)
LKQVNLDAEVAIIGAGPLGIELAVALKRAGISYVQFDAAQIGYTISWFPPQTRFFSSNDRIAIAGVPLQTPDQNKATREVYLSYLRTVVQLFDLKVRTYEPVADIRRESDGFTLTTRRRGRERTWRFRRIVLATGGTARPRRLNIPGEDLPHVHPHWKDPHDYFGQRVLVVGGKNSAVEGALRLHHAGAKVILSYRRDKLPAKSIKYWLLPEINGLMKSGAIGDALGTVPVRITPTHVVLERVVDPERPPGLWEENSGPREVEADFVIPQIGFVADMSLARMAGVELTGDREIPTFNPDTMETNVPGVYLCGTVTGGTQERFTVFIENGHIHVDRIVAHLTGATKPQEPAPIVNPES